MKLKICGLKHNICEVADLQPDYIGFIFWEGSTRFLSDSIPDNCNRIPKRVGVFVDAKPEYILEQCITYNLNLLQLHGSESSDYFASIKALLNANHKSQIQLIKALSVGADFDFKTTEPFLNHVDYLLFDSRGPLPGGNGTRFDWSILEDYPLDLPYFLSGGIAESDVDRLSDFIASQASEFCHALDINSKFERSPGLKDIETLKRFMDSRIWSGNTKQNKI